MTLITTAIGGTDYHSGYYEIVFGVVLNLMAHKQMVVFGGLVIEGVLQIDGQLILEA